jgi:hypothetical protein
MAEEETALPAAAAPSAHAASGSGSSGAGGGGSGGGGIRLYVGNLPKEGQLATEPSLNDAFSKYGRISDQIWIAKKPAGFAYIVSCHSPPSSAAAASTAAA